MRGRGSIRLRPLAVHCCRPDTYESTAERRVWVRSLISESLHDLTLRWVARAPLIREQAQARIAGRARADASGGYFRAGRKVRAQGPRGVDFQGYLCLETTLSCIENTPLPRIQSRNRVKIEACVLAILPARPREPYNFLSCPPAVNVKRSLPETVAAHVPAARRPQPRWRWWRRLAR
jgi:hypothetical protein